MIATRLMIAPMSYSGFPPVPPPQPYSVPPPPPDNRNAWQKMKTWQKIAIPVGGVLVLLIILGSLVGETVPEEDQESASDNTNTSAAAKQPLADPETNEPATKAPAKSAKPTQKPSKTAAPKPTPTPEPKPEPKALQVSAADLLKDYEENEAAADAKYSGKDLEVTGNVGKVDTEFFDNDQYVVMLDNGDEYAFLAVNCNDVSQDQAAKVQVGSTVTVRGKFDDGGDLGIELKDCDVV